jgi:hypothetical protein
MVGQPNVRADAPPRRRSVALVLLASLALQESDAAAAEVTAMPAGGHESLGIAREAVKRRAHAILAKLQIAEEKSVVEALDA